MYRLVKNERVAGKMRKRCHRFRREELFRGFGGWKREAGVVNGIRSGPETAPRRLRGQGKTEKRAEWSCNYAGKTQRCCHCSLLLCRGRCRRFSRPRGHQTTPAPLRLLSTISRETCTLNRPALFDDTDVAFVKRKSRARLR